MNKTLNKTELNEWSKQKASSNRCLKSSIWVVSFLISHLRSIFRTSFIIIFYCFRFNCDTDSWTHFCQARFEPLNQLIDSVEIKVHFWRIDIVPRAQRCEVRWFWIRLWPKNISKRIWFHIRLRSYFIFAVNDFLFYFTDSLSLFCWTNVTPLGIWAQVKFRFLNASRFLNFIKDFLYKSQSQVK